jgi:hypothetical protein
MRRWLRPLDEALTRLQHTVLLAYAWALSEYEPDLLARLCVLRDMRNGSSVEGWAGAEEPRRTANR